MDKLWPLLLLFGVAIGCKSKPKFPIEVQKDVVKLPECSSSSKFDLPAMLDLPVNIYLSPSWRSKFPDKGGLNEAKNVMSLVQKWFQHSSLTTKFFITYEDSDIFPIGEEVEATDSGLMDLPNYITEPTGGRAAIIYLTADTSGTLGTAYPLSICARNKKLPRSINRWDTSTEFTAQTVAHSIGHNLGFYHDFEKYPSVRTGRTFTCGPGDDGGPNQLMHYDEPMLNSWSDCTNEDFKNYYRLVARQPFCLKEHREDCQCGLAKREEMILGGIETEVNEYPWQVGIVFKGESKVRCGGSLISNQWILSAANCFKDVAAAKIQALLGEHDVTSNIESAMIRMDISNIVNHPDYVKRTKNYDFSLLKLKNKVEFSTYSHIRPICLPVNDDKDYTNSTAIITGWGRTTNSRGSESDNLREVEVNVLSNYECTTDYKYEASRITDQMMCANNIGGGDSCRGDSGGPVITSGTGNGETGGQNYELIGVVSWGSGMCGNADYPGVIARVSKQLSWIREITASGWCTCNRT